MILVLSLEDTLRAVAPELERRLAKSLVADWFGGIELAILHRGRCRIDDPTQVTVGESLPGEACRLVIADGNVAMDAGPGQADLQIEMTQAQFVKALFGIAALTELPCTRGMDLAVTERAVLHTLFPRTQAGSGPWG